MILGVEDIFTVGEDSYFSSVSPLNSYGVFFEDDLNTGYFYAADNKNDLTIFDALHIYNVEDVIDKKKPCKIQIAWTKDGNIASLIINNYCHAIFDFQKQESYSRNGFPQCKTGWSRNNSRLLTDELLSTLINMKI